MGDRSLGLIWEMWVKVKASDSGFCGLVFAVSYAWQLETR